MLKLEKLSGSNQQQWNDYVMAHPLGRSAHLVQWGPLFERVFGKKYHYYMAVEEGRCRGVLPLVHIRSALFGNYMTSVPYLNYGGVLADGADCELALFNKAEELAEEMSCRSIEYRYEQAIETGMPAREDKVAMILQLPENEEALGKILGSKRRSQVRRSLKENPEVVLGGEELLSEFYQVFAENMRDLGTPVYSARLFRDIAATFSESVKIVVIRLYGEPVAAAFLLGYKDRLEIPWASSLRRVNKLSVNMLMYWEVLKYAMDAGFAEFDFGRSTVDAGTYRFKKQWGAEPQPLKWYYWLAEGEPLPKLNPSNPKFKLLIQAWQKLPLSIANIVGPHIVKNLP